MARRARPVRPCPPVSWWGIAVIRAAYRLSGDAKHVLALVRELDRGDGAWMSPALMAQQLGMNLSYFKELRAELQRLGLLLRVEVEGSRLDSWFLRLPDGFPTDWPKGAKSDEKRRSLREWADALDRHIKDGKTDLERTEIPSSVPQIRTVFPKAEDGISVLTEHETAANSAPSVLSSSKTLSCTTAVDSDCKQSNERTEQRVSQNGNGGSPVSLADAIAQHWPPALQAEFLRFKSRTTPLGKQP